jgi:DNA helicase-2/ATP-dependent DNA helicase PcrA
LLFKTVELLESKPAVREELQARFPYILVDEYQDINYAQYRFIHLLAGTRGNVCVVGDDDQSIYGWRGADVRLILSFQKDFENTRVIKLEQNYRSTQKILKCAHHVIWQNETRVEKKLWTENGVGENLVLYQAVNEDEEAEWVAATIARQAQNLGIRYGDYAILYRINAMSLAFEAALRERGVPYRVVGEMSFYDRDEVKNLVAYLKLIFNPSDAVSLSRIINTPARGLGSNMVNRLTQVASEAGITLYEALPVLADDNGLHPAQQHAALDFYNMMKKLRKDAEQMGVAELVSRVLDRSGYLRALHNSKRAEDAERADSLNEFVAGAVTYQQNEQEPTLSGFLEHLALLDDIDKSENLSNSVSLMTFHAAKGLEFPVVFMVGMKEGLCPHKRSMYDASKLEEERRLCYVGLTRAERMVYLSYAVGRTISSKVKERKLSRFLNDLPQELVDHSGVSAYASRVRVRRNTTSRAATYADVRETADGSALSKAPRTQKKAPRVSATSVSNRQDVEIFPPGTKIVHDDWGNGVVVSISQDGTLPILTIRFEEQKYKVKKMLAGHPKLKAR